jgi:hypothetical protein
VVAPFVLPQKNLSFDSGKTNGVMPAHDVRTFAQAHAVNVSINILYRDSVHCTLQRNKLQTQHHVALALIRQKIKHGGQVNVRISWRGLRPCCANWRSLRERRTTAGSVAMRALASVVNNTPFARTACFPRHVMRNAPPS